MDIEKIGQQFPMLVNYPELTYLDSAASTLVPQCVLDIQREYYTHYGVNIARGIYDASIRATQAYENARAATARFIGADKSQIVFTSGATESINIIAHGLVDKLSPNSHIAVTATEHHSNLIPWQVLAKKTNSTLDIIGINSNKQLDLTKFAQIITLQTTILALPYVSNVLGNINPLKQIITKARELNPKILIMVDAAAAVGHIPINAVALDCDFLVFSGHKVYGPTGIGVLYGKTKSLNQLTPLLTGGEMVDRVDTTTSTLKDLPHRLEAGTPNIAGAIGLAKALKFIKKIGFKQIIATDQMLIDYAKTNLRKNFGSDIVFYESANLPKIGLLSFSLSNIHPHDIADVLNSQNIAIRAGTHCTQPLHKILQIGATARISFAVYSTTADIDKLITGLQIAQNLFTRSTKKN